MRYLRSLALLLVLVPAMLWPTGARAQLTLSNDLISLFFNDGGYLIVPPPPFPPDTPANGIRFRPTTARPYQELIAKGLTPFEAYGLSFTANGTPFQISNGALSNGTPVSQVVSVTPDPGGGGTFVVDLFNDDPAFGGTPLAQLRQVVTFPSALSNRARVDVFLTNVSNETLSDIVYLRTLNPRQGVDLGSAAVVTERGDAAGTGIFPEGVAVDSEPLPGLGDSTNRRHLALASDIVGARVNAFGSAQDNRFLLLDDLKAPGYAELTGSGAPGQVASDPLSIAVVGSPFETGITALNLFFSHDTGGVPDLAPGQQNVFVGRYFYVFNGFEAPPPGVVPEPGPLALLGAMLLGGTGLAWRRRKT